MRKIDAVQEASLSFNKNIFGNIFKNKRSLEARIKGVQRTLEKVDPVSLLILENKLQREYD